MIAAFWKYVRHFLIFFLVFSIVFLWAAWKPLAPAAHGQAVEQKLAMILQAVHTEHYVGFSNARNFSDHWKRDFIAGLDPYGLIFLKSDVQKLRAFELDLLSPGRTGAGNFLENTAAIYE